MTAINRDSIHHFFASDEIIENIKQNCETSFQLKGENAISLTQGAFGSVSEACLKSNCKYIVKALPMATKFQKKIFNKEVQIATALGKANIAPSIIDVFTCLNTGYIIMDKWDGDYRSLIKQTKKYKRDDLNQIANVIQRMHKLGIIHNDLHIGNILYRVDNGKNIFGITDFGLSLRFESAQDVLSNDKLPNHISPNIFFPAFDYYKLSLSIESLLKKPFVSFFLSKGYLSFLEYILVEKFLFYELDTRDSKKYPNFLSFLQNEDLARDMRRTLPFSPEEAMIPTSLNKQSSKSKAKSKSKSKSKSK